MNRDSTVTTARKRSPERPPLRNVLTSEPSVEVRREPRTKRILDVSLACVGLVLSAPLWLLAAAAIKLDDKGPIFYRQARHGRGGIAFSLLKFRTMRVEDPSGGVHQAIERDQRVTRVGSFLRATGLDELPQLWSILIGDMSLVGPRALALGEVMNTSTGSQVKFEDVPGFLQRLAVKPGLTGLATIYLPKDADPLEKLEHDLLYIREHSFWLDLRLIALSLWISVRGRWETRDAKL